MISYPGVIQMKLIRAMGWSLLACICRSMLNIDDNDGNDENDMNVFQGIL
jgi:hypothetical protein